MTAQLAIVRALPINQIAAPSNVRISNGHDKESLSQLAESIKTHGLIQPIVVRMRQPDDVETGEESIPPKLYVVIAGRRRLAACKLAKMDEIAAIVSETDEAKSYELEIAENIQREQMTLADTARAVRTLMLIHDSAKKVGAILNKSPAWVSKHLAVTSHNFPATIAELLDRNIVQDLETLLLLRQIAEFPAGHPNAVATLTRMLRVAHDGNMNRQIARDALAKLKEPNRPAQPAAPSKLVRTPQVLEQRAEDEETPTTTFVVELPIAYLETLESLGGANWIIEQIKGQNLGDESQHHHSRGGDLG